MSAAHPSKRPYLDAAGTGALSAVALFAIIWLWAPGPLWLVLVFKVVAFVSGERWVRQPLMRHLEALADQTNGSAFPLAMISGVIAFLLATWLLLAELD